MTDSAPPKYSLREFERRWLVDADQAPSIPPGAGVTIQDRYLEGSRLRLRRVVSADGHTVYKLCKKYGDRPGAESITNLYLSAVEYRRLSALPGTVVEKHRHALADGSLDQYARDGDALMILEREFADADAAARFAPPAFAAREITRDEAFSGAALASRFGHVMPSTP
jgi:CYTH domain-containing protein